MGGKPEPIEINKLSKKEKAALKRRHVLHLKYEEAVAMYADTSCPLREIAVKCGVSANALGNYLRRYWRELMLRRHGIQAKGRDPKDIKVIASGQQSPMAYAKYKEAVEACGSLEYIEYNVSQIGRKFQVDGTALANYMRIHYEEIPVWREKVREKLGIADHIRRGVRPICREQYGEAVEMYRTTDKTIPEVADLCHVSEGGLSQHLRFYHKEVLRKRSLERKTARNPKIPGQMSGNGRIHRPSAKTVEKYQEALELYRCSSLVVKEIVRQTGVTLEGFRNYLRVWHRDLMLERRGGGQQEDSGNGYVDLTKTKCYLKSAAAKYAAAIESLKTDPRPLAQVACEYGFQAETFRSYLKEHEPELMAQRGMIKNKDGKYVSKQAAEKYAEAINLYETTTEDLKSIASRLGIVYNSLGGFIRRNCPEVNQKHKELLRKSTEES